MGELSLRPGLSQGPQSVPSSSLSSTLDSFKKLCNLAQAWANHLAQTGILRHKGNPEYGENIFCRNVALALKTRLTVPDITGEEVAAYWYSNVRQYRFNLPDAALHAHAGSYSQMVWQSSKTFGIGKALSRSGKIIIVANYFPPGNITNRFRENVLPLSTRALAAEMLCQGKALLEEAMAEPEEEELSLQKALINIGMGVSGVLAAQPPNITGRNATKILAAHMLGHAAAVVTTPDEKLEVVIVSRKSIKHKKVKDLKTQAISSSKTIPPGLPVSALSPSKVPKDRTFTPYAAKALKDMTNLKLKEQESFSAPNILTSSLKLDRRPKLASAKRVKFKSEENLSFFDRTKAVQTSFSSENLSTEEGCFEAPIAGLSAPSPSESDEETISGWSEMTSSSVHSLNTDVSEGVSSSSSTYDSKSQQNTTLATLSNTTTTDYTTMYFTTRSQCQSTDTSLSQAPLSSGEFRSLEGASVSQKDTDQEEDGASSTSQKDSDEERVFQPKKCSLKRIPAVIKGNWRSQESVSSLDSEKSASEGRSLNSGSETDNSVRSRLHLPYKAISSESGILNCYALSPLHY